MILPHLGAAAPAAHAARGPASKPAKSGFAEALDAALHGHAKATKKKDGKSAKTPPAAQKNPDQPLPHHFAATLPEVRTAPKKHDAPSKIDAAKGAAAKTVQAAPHEAARIPTELAERPKAAELAKAVPQPVVAPADREKPEPATPARGARPPPPELDLPHDPTLSVALMPRAAHLSFRSEGLGDLRLHLRVRDGVADVRIDAAQAALFAPREAELRTVLAGQGLQLGSFDLPPQEQGEGTPPEQDRAALSDAPAAPARASHSATRPAARHAGRIDVEA